MYSTSTEIIEWAGQPRWVILVASFSQKQNEDRVKETDKQTSASLVLLILLTMCQAKHGEKKKKTYFCPYQEVLN